MIILGVLKLRYEYYEYNDTWIPGLSEMVECFSDEPRLEAKQLTKNSLACLLVRKVSGRSADIPQTPPNQTSSNQTGQPSPHATIQTPKHTSSPSIHPFSKSHTPPPPPLNPNQTMSNAPPPKSDPSDTSFRKTWDRATYAAKAADREATYKLESRARHEAKLAGRKYHPPPPTARAHTPPDIKAQTSSSASITGATTARRARLDVSAHVGKTLLVPAGAATGKRGRGAGFYCADCDLTYKDNVQFVEHLNSRQHLVATGQSGEVRRASADEVRERLAWLARRRREEGEEGAVDLGRRLAESGERGEREKAERRRVRNERRRKGGAGVKVEEEDVRGGIIC